MLNTETEPDGPPFAVGCSGGRARHPRRILGRFQRYLRDGKPWGFAEVYASGLTPPADQYVILRDSKWVETDEQSFRSALMSDRHSARMRWSRECPKCGSHYVFDLDVLVRRIEISATRGDAWLDLS